MSWYTEGEVMAVEVTLELVQQLRQYADVSFADAKAALESTNGDLLEALVWLEQHGKIGPSGVVCVHSDPNAPDPMAPQPTRQEEGVLEKLWRWLTENRLECSRGETKFEIPIAVLIALILFACYVVVLGVIFGFCFGWRFHFAGPQLGNKQVNDVMDTIDDTAESIFGQVKDHFKK